MPILCQMRTSQELLTSRAMATATGSCLSMNDGGHKARVTGDNEKTEALLRDALDRR